MNSFHIQQFIVSEKTITTFHQEEELQLFTFVEKEGEGGEVIIIISHKQIHIHTEKNTFKKDRVYR